MIFLNKYSASNYYLSKLISDFNKSEYFNHAMIQLGVIDLKIGKIDNLIKNIWTLVLTRL